LISLSLCAPKGSTLERIVPLNTTGSCDEGERGRKKRKRRGSGRGEGAG